MRLSAVTERPHHDPTNRSPFQVSPWTNHHVSVVFHTLRHITVKFLSRKLVRMDDDVEKRYENMKSKTRALSNII
ncbi:hypothetical protein EJB05_56699, partial [Eragrostis curvula]